METIIQPPPEIPENEGGYNPRKPKANGKWYWPERELRIVIGLLLVFFLLILAGSFAFDRGSEQIAFLLVNVMALVSLALVMISAFNAEKSREIAAHQEYETMMARLATQKAANLTESIVAEMKAQREFYARQVAFNESQIGLMRDQVIQAIGQGKTMQDQFEVMKQAQESFMVSERAYLTIKRLSLTNKPFEANKMPLIAFRVFNGGKTPAFNITCRNGTMLTERPLAEVQEEMIERLGKPVNASYLVGGDSIQATMKTAVQFLDDVSIFAWRAGALRYYWVAQLRYDYIGDQQETTPFWFEYVPHPGLFGVWTVRRVGEFLTFGGQRLTYGGNPLTFTPDERDLPDTFYNEEGGDDAE